jgi:hypothetical protein
MPTQEGSSSSSSSDDSDTDQPFIEEGAFDSNGVRIEQPQIQQRPAVPTYRTRDVQAHEVYRFLPQHWRKFGMLDTIEPWSIIFTDNITMVHGKDTPDTKLFVAYDVATNGIRVKPYQNKHELGEIMDRIIVEEALHKRSKRVTVGADGDGAMSLVREACFKRGVSWLPIPPWQPHLNPVELAVSHLKAGIASQLLGACSEGGPLKPAHAHYAATYIAHMNERFASTRRSETYRGQHYSFSSPWKLNVGTDPNLDRLVPWGQPGYAYIPAELRKARGAPKYLRAEPVLMLGYQFMYTDVYKVLTRHGTTLHTEQVSWCMDKPKGVFPEVGGEREHEACTRLSIDDIMSQAPTQDAASSDQHTSEGAATQSAQPDEVDPSPAEPPQQSIGAKSILRLNVDRVTTGKGPVPYILARCEALDGVPYESATGTRYLDAQGRSKSYKRQDLEYDLHCGWLRVDIESSDGKTLITSCQGWQHHSDNRWGHHHFANLVSTLGATNTDMGKLSAQLSAHAFLAMKDMAWSKYLHGPDHEAIMRAYNKEWDALCGSVLRELHPEHPDYQQAKELATQGRLLLEFKRVGIWKVRAVVRAW